MVNSSPDKLGEERLSRVGNITVSCILEKKHVYSNFCFQFWVILWIAVNWDLFPTTRLYQVWSISSSGRETYSLNHDKQPVTFISVFHRQSRLTDYLLTFLQHARVRFCRAVARLRKDVKQHFWSKCRKFWNTRTCYRKLYWKTSKS